MKLFGSFIRELNTIVKLFRAQRASRHVRADGLIITPDDLERSIDKHAERPAFIFEHKTVSYAEFDALANQVAHWGLSKGLTVGDTVALFMLNRPLYVAVWYGLSKIGVITALLNNQLASRPLAHCIDVSEAKIIIIDAEIASVANTSRRYLDRPCDWLISGGDHPDISNFDDEVARMPSIRPARSYRADLRGRDIVLKMFTSGTTGLPKAAKISHTRAMNYMISLASLAKAGPDDRVLLTLPLYHATGGLIGVGAALMFGGTVILEKGFSASRFWEAAADYGATVFIYVGELCRFLATAKPHPKERKHALRYVIGNGLRPDVWELFQSRFNIKNIMEFYGSTEGNASLVNIDGVVGSIGRVPPYLRKSFNIKLVEYSDDAGAPIRGGDGYCKEVGIMQVGEALGEIRTDDSAFSFDGYAGDVEETDRKILRDVFKQGDAWFRTGDLMRQNKNGYFFFVDRVGDTFRWRSENVSTSEIAATLGMFDGVLQAVVFGVEVPGCDGRAGMAALNLSPGTDLNALHAYLKRELSSPARPVFLRILSGAPEEADTTGTYKLVKNDLVKVGFDPGKTDDPLYFDSPQAGTFVSLGADLYKAIATGEARL